MKKFEWQYSDEKLLLKKHENIISFISNKFYILVVNIILWLIIWWVSFYFLKSFLILFIIVLLFTIFWIFYLRLIYKDTWIIITSRRVLKLVRTWFFSNHKKELKLADIKATLASRKWILWVIFGYWNITIQWTEEHSNIYFKWMNDYSDITNYIWRIQDYIKLNWHTDNLSSFKTKKERKK